MNVPLLIAGGGAALLFASPGVLRRGGVPIPAYVTPAQLAAVSALPPVLGVAYSSSRPNEFTERFNDLKRGLIAQRGFKIVNGRSYTQFTGADYEQIISAFFAAVRAGVIAGGYRITATRLVGVDLNGEASLDKVLSATSKTVTLMGVTMTERLPFALTALGDAVYAAELERRRVGIALAQDHVRTDAIIYKLCNEMDDAGYLVTGKPPPDPRIADGIAHAATVTVGTVAGGVGSIAGGAAGIVAGALLGSPLFWAAGLALAGWKVLR